MFNRTESLSRLLVGAVVAVLLSACAPAAAPVVTGAGGAVGDEPWVAEWNALIDAAKKEGKVVVKGNADDALRTEFPKAFTDTFGIDVEYLGTTSSEFVVKIDRERAAGLYTVDVVMGGTVFYASFYQNQWLDPLPPSIFIHPDAKDVSKWPDGKYWFADPEEKYLLRLTNTVAGNVFVNTDQIKPGTLTSWYDLLKPEYAGKIASDDVENQSNGHNLASNLYLRLGEDFIRQLYLGQKVAMIHDQRQLADAAARGSYPIVLGLSEEQNQRITDDGLPVVMNRDLRELAGVVGGSASLTGIVKDAPHPNAAKLFMNWLAMKDGMTAYAKAAKLVPVRSDIDKSGYPAYLVPEPGKEYVDTSDYEFATKTRLPAGARIRAIIRGEP